MNKKLNVSSPRGRPTKKWHQNIEEDLCAWDLHEDIALNRDMWRKEIKMDREMPRRLSFAEWTKRRITEWKVERRGGRDCGTVLHMYVCMYLYVFN